MITRQQEMALEKVSPFEIKNTLISMASAEAQKSTATLLNAGRGNPNWIATEPREAFFLLGQFAMQECRRVYDNPVGIAGIPSPDGIGKRFEDFLAANSSAPGAKLLKDTFDYIIKRHGANPDDLAHEWAEGIMGDQYPTPDRILRHTEEIVMDYLEVAMGGIETGKSKDYPVDSWKLFATEGSTAGMCYVFASLQANKLMAQGDGLALLTPIFTPYLEIPELARFNFKVTEISANKVEKDGYHTWQYPDEEINKLRDKSIKAVCIVNPSNPPSYTFSQHTLDLLVDIVKNDNPELMIITDDVYGTFVEGFKSLMYVLPYNTMCLYSFSKYFGATGWRAAVVAINDHNIFDDKLHALPAADKALLYKRYSSLTPDPDNMFFIDRMVADSRMVALNHTAGLSTPVQIQMSLFSSFALLNYLNDGNTFQDEMRKIITSRLEAMWQTTGFTLVPDPLRAGYYSEIDIMVWAKKFYGDDFAQYLQKNYEPLDFVMRLASETAVVLLNGDGFAGPAWSVRASLANLKRADYLQIGTAIRKILDEYHALYLKQTKQS
ncbi:MAG: bifunctional aspartate transaminase/aspartate 4-decarboxylase [Muribaculaceae bacterium]|nr:bifunctional aspartate transaminase/aspartate 4-decarboxylase [Muribaculaceae bacterium]